MYNEEGKFREARAYFEQTLALKPEFLEAWNNLGLVFLEKGDLDSAEQAFMYVGNIEGTGGNTRCPSCDALLVERAGLTVVRSRLSSSGACPDCGEAIPGTGWGWESVRP